ncbi:response regulator transcription factor [Paenibacillus ehimensis]|uniref:Response regulator n=1 Tax=Paenibacillus ehimensis TaxID=79264 RepID=A0ABT8V6E1_9BACL|nr:response regulator [Paenibacillus ehimensis]MDO3677009.1 response regulator [Paenibacillus ehimensis]MEC0208814.1 response regulator [Paenibacillus ehimensis]
MNAKPLKVLIADDEVIIRRGLISTVPWDKYGMTVVADVPNGRRGWEAFLEHRPDVVITDIVMPEMDGIELARKVKACEPRTKILLLSCHRDFEYAQQGIKLGASGYLLKTSFNDEELEEFLAAFRQELGKDGAEAPQHIADHAAPAISGLLLEWLYGVGDQFPAELDRLLQGAWSWMNAPTALYLISAPGKCGGMLVQELRGDAAGEPCEVLPFGDGHLLLFVPEGRQREWDGRLSEHKAGRPELHWSRLAPLAGREAWIEAVRKARGQMELEKRYRISVGEWPAPIAEAVQLIVRHTDTQLSVSEVAQEVGLSRSHFSTLFKKTVGESFVSFTYRTKLKIACELLGAQGITVQGIADKIGMPDAKYFSKWFKRCTGKTPSQYRSERREERSVV